MSFLISVAHLDRVVMVVCSVAHHEHVAMVVYFLLHIMSMLPWFTFCCTSWVCCHGCFIVYSTSWACCHGCCTCTACYLQACCLGCMLSIDVCIHCYSYWCYSRSSFCMVFTYVCSFVLTVFVYFSIVLRCKSCLKCCFMQQLCCWGCIWVITVCHISVLWVVIKCVEYLRIVRYIINTCIYAYKTIHTHTYTHTCTLILACLHACMHTHAHTYMHAHTHLTGFYEFWLVLWYVGVL